MTEHNLMIEFKNNHFRLTDGKLCVSSNDKFLIDRQRKFLKDLTNSMPGIKTYGDKYQLHYNFNMINFHKVILLMKKYNLGVIKTLKRDIDDVVMKKNELFLGKYSVYLKNIFRVFVNPEKNTLSIVTKPNLISYTYQAKTYGDFIDKVKEIKANTDQFNEFIDPILNGFKKKKIEERNEDIERFHEYELVLDTGETKIFRSEKSFDRVQEVCKKLYGENIVSIEEKMVQKLEDLVAEYNIKVQKEIKRLQELKI